MKLDERYIRSILGDRPKGSHKGMNGRGLMITGSPGMCGASVMSAAACLRAGIGTLKVLTCTSVLPFFSVLPEAMTLDAGDDWSALDSGRLTGYINGATAIGIGCGMGGGDGVLSAVMSVIRSDKPALLDADALNAIARHDIMLRPDIIITPHLGEMSRLTGLSISELEFDMERHALEYSIKHNCTVLLKSAVSIIASPDGRTAINETGNPGLAKGGSGDVLAGITTAMLGQNLSAFDAACAGAFLLGTSADTALSLLSERFLMARDVIDAVAMTADRYKT